jgi:F-type H+-transporting ATPase subunit gamma
MPAELKEVRQRIASTRQIRRVTGTLQRVAAARLRQDRLAIENADRYLAQLRRTLACVVAAAPGVTHPLMGPTRGGPACIVVFGADRGLCGGFTSSLMEELDRWKGETPADAVHVVAVGKLVQRRARRAGWRVVRGMRQPSVLQQGVRRSGSAADAIPRAAQELIREVAASVTRTYLEGGFGAVHVLYARFVSGLRQRPSLERIMPVSLREAAAGASRGTVLGPGAEGILNRLLPEYVFRWMLDAFLNSMGSEDAARQMAMSRATQNAGDLLEQLIVSYRRLRQDSITTEMVELCGAQLDVRRN